MSARRTNPFTSSASVSTRRDSGRSARASTSTAETAAAPTDILNEPSTSSPHSPLESNRSVSKRRDSPRSTRTSTSNVTGSPTYNGTGSPPFSSNEPDLSIANDRSERRVRGSSASFPSTSSITPPESENAFERTETPPAAPTEPDSVAESDDISESPVEIPRPAGRYIYYRVYAEDGAIPTSNPVYSDDPYLGRISAKLVTPPQTAINLRHCLSGVENIDEDIPTMLFVSASSQTPMDDTDRVPILAYPGPGCMPDDPVALVVVFPEDRRPSESPEADLPASQEASTPFETKYLYYQVYKKRGAVPSKQPADSDDPYVGRISVDSVPPPHTTKSIVRCISKVEHIENSMQSQLYVNISSESPIEEGYISILTSDRPGSTPEDPLAFVEPYPAFPYPMRVITSWSSNSHPGWLVTRAGEILRTTGDEPRNQPIVTIWGPTQLLAYEAANDAGKMGFVLANSVEPIDDDAAGII